MRGLKDEIALEECFVINNAWLSIFGREKKPLQTDQRHQTLYISSWRSAVQLRRPHHLLIVPLSYMACTAMSLVREKSKNHLKDWREMKETAKSQLESYNNTVI